jgi:hypothetical protein
MSGDGHNFGIKAAEKCHDEVEPAREEQERSLASEPPILQLGSQSPGTKIKVAASKRHRRAFLAFGQKSEEILVRLFLSATPQELDQADR